MKGCLTVTLNRTGTGGTLGFAQWNDNAERSWCRTWRGKKDLVTVLQALKLQEPEDDDWVRHDYGVSMSPSQCRAMFNQHI
jgi:hypothetical protein